jgi:hypothetical protein
MKTIFNIFIAFIFITFVSCEKEEEERIKDENYNPEINPANFGTVADNEYFPLIPGTVWTYTGNTEDGQETDVVTVLNETKNILGITCTIVHDVVSLEGTVIEDTYDWYAQDLDGNVWYFGEDVSNYENGVFQDKDGSFEAGVDGALPGIIMMAEPVLQMPYRQEYYFNNAEDWGKLIETGVSVSTPFGDFTNCLKTEDWNALETDAPIEYKYYAPGIGVVREEVVGTSEVMELVSITTEKH